MSANQHITRSDQPLPSTPSNASEVAADKRFGIVDCNNFYASCERMFAPHLIGKPVVVLSNNDGCIIARSNEAKALGIGMGMAYFKSKQILKKHDVAVFSSNYALYGDLSNRVMTVLATFAPRIEVYSIDEAFLDFQGFDRWDMDTYGREICDTTEQWTGIPVSIGFGATKTLAKRANRLSKKTPGMNGVFDFSSCDNPDALLSNVAVGDIWGVGRRWADRLQKEGVNTAFDLQQCDPAMIKQRFNVVLARTVQELRGVSCIELEEVQADRQQVLCSRSFGVRVTDFKDMRHAVTHFMTRASEKLRKQNLLANVLSVHVSTSPFDDNNEYYSNSSTSRLVAPTNDSRELIRLAQRLLKSIYVAGHSYQRAGVMLSDLVSQRNLQQDLFNPSDGVERSDALMNVLDTINSQMGNGTLSFAGEGFGGGWRMKQLLRSPRYTTRVSELKTVR